MMRTLPALLGLTFVFLVISAGAQDSPKGPKKFDPNAAFKWLDVNKDGKLSRAEFDRLMPKQPPAVKDKIFKHLDGDGDGWLTQAEFAKFARIVAAQQGKKAPEPATPILTGPATPEQIAFFEKKIRPVLADHCYQCHSAQAKKIKAQLVLDTRAGIRKGGESGPAVVPGNVQASLLIRALQHTDENLKMPPKDKLPDAVIADFVAWVKMGAPDPRDGPAVKVAYPEIDIAKGKQFWAFQPPRKVAPPAVKNGAWPRGAIDRFLLAGMETKGLQPVADASRTTLLRRIYLDLIGLPPAPDEIEAFLADDTEDAVARVVDRLLASPHFGERWGRHWLDVARYAESTGKQVNMKYPHAWRYRDYVIAAFNADKPYNQFIKEQIAGDLLPYTSEKQHAEQLIATGFLAIGTRDVNERNRLLFLLDNVDEQLDTAGQAFLGLTIACARCHDHKFDPIPQKDYYSLAGIFKSTQPLYGTIKLVQNQHPAPLVPLSAASGQPAGKAALTPAEKKKLLDERDELTKERAELTKQGLTFPNLKVIRNGIKQAQLNSQIASYEADGTPKKLAMAVHDQEVTDDCPLYVRGEVDKPGPKVPRGFLQVLTDRPATIAKGSGRLQLADWLASPDNPLTARVMVNRVWGHLFGRGLVATPDNFGAAGQPPSHPELLDHLAVTFVTEDAWSVKKLIRRLVLSRAYQLSSQPDDRNREIDPDNVYVWRMSKRRLDAETLRDSILAVSGTLQRTPFKGSIVAKNGEGYTPPVLGTSAVDSKFPFRSVYLPVLRNQVLEVLALFDFPDPSMVVGQRSTTTVPAQALFFLNNPWLIGKAEALAGIVERRGEGGEGRGTGAGQADRERVNEAYLRCFARPASDSEIQDALAFIDRYLQSAAGNQTPVQQRRQAWTAFCQALFGSAEFLHRN